MRAQLLIAVSFLLSTVVNPAYSATYTYLDNAAFTSHMAGLDLLWNTPDDFDTLSFEVAPNTFVEISGFNPLGHSSGWFLNEEFTFGTISGSFEASNGVVTSLTRSGTLNSIFNIYDPQLNMLITEQLTPGSMNNTLIINPDNTATSSWSIDGINPFGPYSYLYSAAYVHFNNGDDYNTIFAGNTDLIDQINYILPLMPAQWESVFLGMGFFQFYEAGSPINLSGHMGEIFYTSAVPVPPAVILMLSALGGLGLYGRKR